MKTKQELENRLKELDEWFFEWRTRLEAYGSLETPVNTWRGRKKEFEDFEEKTTEQLFIQRALKYLF